MRHVRDFAGSALLSGFVVLLPPDSAQAQSKEKVRYSFTGKGDRHFRRSSF